MLIAGEGIVALTVAAVEAVAEKIIAAGGIICCGAVGLEGLDQALVYLRVADIDNHSGPVQAMGVVAPLHIGHIGIAAGRYLAYYGFDVLLGGASECGGQGGNK